MALQTTLKSCLATAHMGVWVNSWFDVKSRTNFFQFSLLGLQIYMCFKNILRYSFITNIVGIFGNYIQNFPFEIRKKQNSSSWFDIK